MFVIGVIFIQLVIFASSVFLINVSEKLQKTAYVEGDFIIGALIPVHGLRPLEIDNMDPLYCDGMREANGIQQVEAALFAIDSINQDKNLLPGVKLGITIKDECWNELGALYQTIKLIEEPSPLLKVSTNDACIRKRSSPLISILGTSSSTSAHQVQNILKVFKIPQIGYSAPVLDLRYPYFYLSVVPNDYHEAYIIFKLLKKFGWTYISIAYTNGYLGVTGKFLLHEWAPLFNICIASSVHVPQNEMPLCSYTVSQLFTDKRAKVIVCFCDEMTINALYKKIKELNLTGQYLVVAINDKAVSHAAIEGCEEQAQGSIMISTRSRFIKEFDEYFFQKTLANNRRNPWFEEFWEYQFKCKRNAQDKSNLPVCTGKENLKQNYEQSPKVSYIIKSVYALARGLDDMRKDVCKNSQGACPDMFPFNTTKYMEYMTRLNFSYHGEYVNFFFNGSPKIASYDVFNFQKLPNNSFAFIKVSEYSCDFSEKIDFESSYFYHNFNYFDEVQFPDNSKIPIKSSCSDPCYDGHIQVSGNMDKSCCWTCVPCLPHEITLNKTFCEPCPDGFWPNGNKTVCKTIPTTYIWTDFQFFMIRTFSLLGIMLSLTTSAIFYIYKNTPVVKSSTPELCFIILLGSIMMHCTAFFTVAEPSFINCGLIRVVRTLSTTVVYAPLLVKTNRIARLLAISKKKFPNLHPRFMTLNAQIAITMILILIQMIICSMHLIYEPPLISRTYQKDRTMVRKNVTCILTDHGEMFAFMYNVLLIFCCTYYAIKTRNVPDNFNEAKFIGFVMYISCLISASFALIYHGSDLKMLAIGVSGSINGFSVIVLLFFPKLYIIIWTPDRNTREHFTTTTEIRCNIGRSQEIVNR